MPLADHVVDQVLRGRRQHQAGEPIDQHEREAERRAGRAAPRSSALASCQAAEVNVFFFFAGSALDRSGLTPGPRAAARFRFREPKPHTHWHDY